MARIHRKFCIIITLCVISILICLYMTELICHPGSSPEPTYISDPLSEPAFTIEHKLETFPPYLKNASHEKEDFQEFPTDWQIVSNTKKRFYVYSAYYDHISDRIKVIGATWINSTDRIQCRYYNDMKMPISGDVNGKFRAILENWRMNYSACFITCEPLEGPISVRSLKPRYVSLLAPETSLPSNFLQIQYPSDKVHNKVDFAVCVKPVQKSFNRFVDFIEWIEFHKLMGVRKFTFFNYSIGNEVSCVMKEYGNEVEVLPWSISFRPGEMRYPGLLASFNDCIYRYRGAAKYVVMVDLDEMIVPRSTTDYAGLIQQLNERYPVKNAINNAYYFQHTFFFMHWPNDESPIHNLPDNSLAQRVSNYLVTARKTRRDSKMFKHGLRSKYICNPDEAVEAGNHVLWKIANGSSIVRAQQEFGFVHHYRRCDSHLCKKCAKLNGSIEDKFVQENYSQKLALLVADKLESMAEKCGLDLSILSYSRPTCV